MKCEYRKITDKGVKLENIGERQFLSVEPQILTLLAEEAFHDLEFYLRAEHLDEWAKIVDDTTASDNERFVCSNLIKNAIISSEGKLPLCQDTGTASPFCCIYVVIPGKRPPSSRSPSSGRRSAPR